MYMYICTHTCIRCSSALLYTHMHTCTHSNIDIYIHTYVRINISTYVCICTCVHIYIYVCVLDICTFVYLGPCYRPGSAPLPATPPRRLRAAARATLAAAKVPGRPKEFGSFRSYRKILVGPRIKMVNT